MAPYSFPTYFSPRFFPPFFFLDICFWFCSHPLPCAEWKLSLVSFCDFALFRYLYFGHLSETRPPAAPAFHAPCHLSIDRGERYEPGPANPMLGWMARDLGEERSDMRQAFGHVIRSQRWTGCDSSGRRPRSIQDETEYSRIIKGGKKRKREARGGVFRRATFTARSSGVCAWWRDFGGKGERLAPLLSCHVSSDIAHLFFFYFFADTFTWKFFFFSFYSSVSTAREL